jgi:hypothetical protein
VSQSTAAVAVQTKYGCWLTSRRVAGVALVALCLFVPSLARGQTLDDFKTAAGNKGVDSIPFSDLRKEATSISDEVKTRKEEVKQFKEYDIYEKQKTNLLAEVKELNDLIEQEKKIYEKYAAGNPEAFAKLLADAIKEFRYKVTKIENESIQKMNDEMTKAADVWDRLAQARGGLREKFDDVKDKLADAKSNPDKYLGSSASDDDKKKLGEYVDAIKSGIEAEEANHREQENGAKSTSQKFEALIKKTS